MQHIKTRLVAASKTQPAEVLAQVYAAGQRHFGENYVQELVEKADALKVKCVDIKWHFIGHLQTNKLNKLLSVPNLYMVESVHSEKLAAALNKAWPQYRQDLSKLNVMVQINTSGEKEKSGVAPNEATTLYKFVLENCPNLCLKGLMTIGLYGYDVNDGPNPDFITLKQCREEVCKNLKLNIEDVDLSMGMTADYEQAVNLYI